MPEDSIYESFSYGVLVEKSTITHFLIAYLIVMGFLYPQ